MTIIYRDEFNDWGVERDEGNKLFCYFFDTGMGGRKYKVEIGEAELDFAVKEKPDMYAMYAHIKKKFGDVKEAL